MFYTFSMGITALHTAAAPNRIELPLSPGIIHQVDILFQAGCAHVQHVQIFDASLQVWPFTRGETIRGDATVVSFREFYELTNLNNVLTAYAWTDDPLIFYDVVLQIGVLPRNILQPFSLAELLRAIRR